MTGFLLVIIGAIFLFKNLGFILGSVWDIVWPVLLIVAGLNLIFRRSSGGLFWKEPFGWRRKALEREGNGKREIN